MINETDIPVNLTSEPEKISGFETPEPVIAVIRVDADACPASVRRILERTARKNQIRLVFYIDDSHELEPEYGTVIRVGQGHDAVDLALVNQAAAGDLIITQDYGLGALALARKALVLHPSGLVLDDGNIDQLLFERHISARIRKAGGRTSHLHKRTTAYDQSFEKQLQLMIKKIL
ncbi:MAG: DUF188 domain-containing protein [Clostridiaceae bacterium]|nr:DUF188 domain-containing protein [Clostridiaceae bacterium]